MNRIRRHLDIDQVLIFFLLAVTIRQMGAYLATYSGPVGYLQAIAIDLAIWRSAWWYRKYRGRKQRRWALLGVVLFAGVSAWYNKGFYSMQNPSLAWWQAWLMGAILPAGVALLSYLYGQKDASQYSSAKDERPTSEPEPQPANTCAVCGRSFAKPNGLNAHMRTHRKEVSE